MSNGYEKESLEDILRKYDSKVQSAYGEITRIQGNVAIQTSEKVPEIKKIIQKGVADK